MLDLIIIVTLGFQAYFWFKRGLVRGFFSLGGFWLGLISGAWLAPHVIGVAGEDPGPRLLFAFCVIFGLAVIGQMIGQAIGSHLGYVTNRLRLGKADSVLGSVFGVTMTLVIIWLGASIVSGMPLRETNRQIRESEIIHALNDKLPPAPDVLSDIASLINADGYPQVFSGLEPPPVEPVAPPKRSEVLSALDVAKLSTVKVEGPTCEGLATGSGFLVAKGLVMTNAHVLAGVDTPIIIDSIGRHTAVPVHFDPDRDIAVLRADGLVGEPLKIANKRYPRGTTGTVLGYPLGGPLQADPAGILRQIDARGRNIYGKGLTTRSVYELQAEINQGNSGGPLLLRDGTVIGLVFAKSIGYDDIGYALTADEFISLAQRANTLTRPVQTGPCT